jgi:hypothetical protein
MEDAQLSTAEYVLAPWDGEAPTHTLHTKGVAHCLFADCFNGQTLEAYSTLFEQTVWLQLPCNQWSCRRCAQRKIKQLANRTERAKPNRLLTLTIDPSLWTDPRSSFDGTRRQVSELVRKLRDRFGEVEYLRVTELTTKGWPHYHLLIRSDYIPHSVVKKIWASLTGATIVDLRQVKNQFQTYTYLVKYLTKMHKLKWTNRHVSTSKKFFPPEPVEKPNKLGLTNKTVIECHPGNYLYELFRGATLVELTYGVFALTRPDEETSPETTEERQTRVYRQKELDF